MNFKNLALIIFMDMPLEMTRATVTDALDEMWKSINKWQENVELNRLRLDRDPMTDLTEEEKKDILSKVLKAALKSETNNDGNKLFTTQMSPYKDSKDTLYLVFDIDGSREDKDVNAVLTDDPNSVKLNRRDNGWILNIVPKPSQTSLYKALPSCNNETDDDKSDHSEEVNNRSSDFVISSMGFFTKKYFAIQENIDTSKQMITEVQDRLSPGFLKKVSFSQMYENLDSPKQMIFDIHEQYSPSFLKKAATFTFPNAS